MTFVLHALRLLAVAVWVGGLVFFAAVEAPVAFRVLGATTQFAQLIGGSVAELNQIGHACGFFFLLTAIALWSRTSPSGRRLLMMESVLIIVMILATKYVQSGILPAMERDRSAAGGDINAVPQDNPARVDFDRLHARSERVEGSILFLGLGVVLLMAAEPISYRPAAPTPIR
jgi:putative copper export protein